MGSRQRQLLYLDSHRSQVRSLGSQVKRPGPLESQHLARVALANNQQDLGSPRLVKQLNPRLLLASHLDLSLRLASLRHQMPDLDKYPSHLLGLASLEHLARSDRLRSHPRFRSPRQRLPLLDKSLRLRLLKP